MPNSPASSRSSSKSEGRPAPAMSRMASAPCARDSYTWYMVTMKSLRRTGRSTAARAARRSSSEPPKLARSVSTEMQAAPPRA